METQSSDGGYTIIGGNEGEPPLNKNDIVILVMGATGTGKSTFISAVTGKGTDGIGHELGAKTSLIQLYSCKLPGTTKRCILVDTVGFDDANKSDADVLEAVAIWLSSTYRQKIIPSGLIFLHKVTDNRMSGGSARSLQIFKSLCGDECLKNVVLVTTMWDLVENDEIGSSRESELQSNITLWKSLLARGAQYRRFVNTKESGLEILNLFISNERLPFRIQREIVDRGYRVSQTLAGGIVDDQWDNTHTSVLSRLKKGMKKTGDKFPLFLSKILGTTDPKEGGLPNDENYTVILLMGATGTGKSTFIHTVTGEDAGVDHRLSSPRNLGVTLHAYKRPTKKNIWLVEFPAFDDSHFEDADVLQIYVAWLTATYSLSVIPSGILFFQRISDLRASETTIKNLKMCRRLCGEGSLKNLIIVTTSWDLVDEPKGESNENYFATSPLFWKPFIDRGCQVHRFTNTQQSGMDIIQRFETESWHHHPLQIQIEMVERKMRAGKTSAGILVVDELEGQVKEHEQAILELVKIRGGQLKMNQMMVKATEEELEMVIRERKKTKERIAGLKRRSMFLLRGL